MVKFCFAAPNAYDITELAQNLRQSDIQELCALGHSDWYSVVQVSVQVSDPEFCWAVRTQGRLVALGGCSHTGNPWLLGTPLLCRYAVSLTRLARRRLGLMLGKYGHLSNLIDCRQTQTRRWLKGLGFVETRTVEVVRGFPLVVFEMGQ